MNCPHCQKELPENNGAICCPFCDCKLIPTSISIPEAATPSMTTAEKKQRWRSFWWVFIITPFASIAFIPLVFIGALIAGFTLAKIYTKTQLAFFATGILFSLGVLATYIAILFVGCSIASH